MQWREVGECRSKEYPIDLQWCAVSGVKWSEVSSYSQSTLSSEENGPLIPHERLSVKGVHDLLTFGIHKQSEDAHADAVEKVSARLLKAMALGSGLWRQPAAAHVLDAEKLARKAICGVEQAQVPQGPAASQPRGAAQMHAALYTEDCSQQYELW